MFMTKVLLLWMLEILQSSPSNKNTKGAVPRVHIMVGPYNLIIEVETRPAGPISLSQ